jgi:hypothetical protein
MDNPELNLDEIARIRQMDIIITRIMTNLNTIIENQDRMTNTLVTGLDRINNRLDRMIDGSAKYPLNIHTKVMYVDTLENCPICDDTLNEIKTECGHSFCEKCIQKWMTSNHSSCPYCRTHLTNTLFYRLHPTFKEKEGS